jgi:ADP-ribose pyrophosphatase YjhB (NUDIX family)
MKKVEARPKLPGTKVRPGESLSDTMERLLKMEFQGLFLNATLQEVTVNTEEKDSETYGIPTTYIRTTFFYRCDPIFNLKAYNNKKLESKYFDGGVETFRCSPISATRDNTLYGWLPVEAWRLVEGETQIVSDVETWIETWSYDEADPNAHTPRITPPPIITAFEEPNIDLARYDTTDRGLPISHEILRDMEKYSSIISGAPKTAEV